MNISFEVRGKNAEDIFQSALKVLDEFGGELYTVDQLQVTVTTGDVLQSDDGVIAHRMNWIAEINATMETKEKKRS